MLDRLIRMTQTLMRSPIISAGVDIRLMGHERYMAMVAGGLVVAMPYPSDLPDFTLDLETAKKVARLIGKKTPKWELVQQKDEERVVIHADHVIKASTAVTYWEIGKTIQHALEELERRGEQYPASIAQIVVENGDHRSTLQYITFNGQYAASTDGYRMKILRYPSVHPPLPAFVSRIKADRFVYLPEIEFEDDMAPLSRGAVLAAYGNGKPDLIVIFNPNIAPPERAIPVENFLPNEEFASFPVAFFPRDFLNKAKLFKHPILIIKIREKKTIFRLRDGEIEIETEVSVGGKPALIGLNPHFLMDALPIGPAHMYYRPASEGSVATPVTFDAGDRKYILMPLAIEPGKAF